MADPREALKASAESILRAKLENQAKYFRCPEWAAVPTRGACLEAIEDGKVKEYLPTTQHPYYLFGRDDAVCDFYLPHKTASRLHFGLIHHKLGSWYLLDLNSAGGTYLNEKPLQPMEPYALGDGDYLRAAESTCIYRFRWLSRNA